MHRACKGISQNHYWPAMEQYLERVKAVIRTMLRTSNESNIFVSVYGSKMFSKDVRECAFARLLCVFALGCYLSASRILYTPIHIHVCTIHLQYIYVIYISNIFEYLSRSYPHFSVEWTLPLNSDRHPQFQMRILSNV